MHHPSLGNTMTDRLQLQDGLERLSKRSLGQQSQRQHHASDTKEATQERRKRIDQLRSSLQVPLSPLPQNTHADLNSDDEESLDGSISSWMDKSRKLFGRTSSKSKADLDGSSSSLFGAKSLFSFGSGNKSGGTLETAPEDVSECSLEEDLFDRQDNNNNNNTSKSNSFNNSFLGKYIVQKKPTQAAQEDLDRSEKVRRREAAQELLAGKTQELTVEPAPRPRRDETHSRRSHRPSRARAGSDDVDASMRRRRHRRGTKEPSPEGPANRRRRGSMEPPARRREDERAARPRRRRSSIGAAEPPKLAAMNREESSRRRMRRGSVTGSSPTGREEPRTPRSTVRSSAVAPSSPRTAAAARRQSRRSSQVEGSSSEDQRRTKHLPPRQRTR